MHDLETIKRMNQGAGHAPKVASDGRVCTEYHSRQVQERFFCTYDTAHNAAFIHDTVPLQGYGTFGPMNRHDAEALKAILNNLTKV